MIKFTRALARAAVTTIAAMSIAPAMSQAQTVKVNGSDCAGATVTFGQNVININTSSCGAVAVAPTITLASPPAGNTGSAYTYTFGASGSPTPTWSVSAGTLPTGLSLSSAGVLSGTPTVAGAYTFTVQATNTAGSATQAVSNLMITAPSGPPVITSATPPATVAQGGAYNFTFTATGALPISWTISSGFAPAGMTLSTAGALSAASVTGAPGVYNFAVTAANGTSPNATQNVSITVNAAQASPTITNVTPSSGLAGSTATINGTNFVVGSTTVTVGGVAATVTNGTTTSLPITIPASLMAGSQAVVVTVAGATSTANSTFTVTSPVVGADTSLDDGLIPSPSKRPFVIPPFRNGKLNGAGPDMNAYAIETTSCANSNAQLTSSTAGVTRRWQHNIDLSAYQQNTPVEYVSMAAGEAFTFMFTPTTGYRFIQFNEATVARMVPTFMSISTTPCDFDVSKLASGPGRDYCYVSSNTANSVYYQVTTGAVSVPFCKLTPGTKYYLNIRFLDARPTGGNLSIDSCAASGYSLCGGVLQIQ